MERFLLCVRSQTLRAILERKGGQGLRIEKVKKKGLDKINWIKELLINFKRMLGVMKELWLLGYRATGAAIAAIHERPVPMANYLLQIFIETNEQLTLKK